LINHIINDNINTTRKLEYNKKGTLNDCMFGVTIIFVFA